jgi:hypothetical protein
VCVVVALVEWERVTSIVAATFTSAFALFAPFALFALFARLRGCASAYSRDWHTHRLVNNADGSDGADGLRCDVT